MEYRPLSKTGISVSAVAFGAGPVAQLLTGDHARAQYETVETALASGINWFDTAATYGDGRSEENLGRILAELGAVESAHVATKVRLTSDQLSASGSAVRESLLGSLRRLSLARVTLLQIHNSITREVGSQPTSITPAHVLSSGGTLDALQQLQREGLVEHLGLTGLGDTEALTEVIDSGAFVAMQVPYNLFNPSAGRDVPADFPETNHGNLIATCAARGMSVFAIRVLAGGALVAQPPSPHTLKTPFFPIDLYQRDCRRAEELARILPADVRPEEAALRFALIHPSVTSAIVGFATPDEVTAMARYAGAGPLDIASLGSFNSNSSQRGPRDR